LLGGRGWGRGKVVVGPNGSRERWKWIDVEGDMGEWGVGETKNVRRRGVQLVAGPNGRGERWRSINFDEDDGGREVERRTM